ncbi:MAG: PAS domain S-box protein, partial [Cyclobacteriaceae bacterium]|nr:PAS domain S-box protein [Cyclobacteriaceae bacterium HetDA_MAG_MS6]
ATGEPHVRFYAGAPLTDRDGYTLGTLCVIDHQERHLTEEQHEALWALSRQVVAQLHLRKEISEKKRLDEEYEALLQNLGDGVFELDSEGKCLYANKTLLEMLETTMEKLAKASIWDIIHQDDVVAMKAYYGEQFRKKSPECYYEYRLVSEKGKVIWIGQKTTMQYEGSKMVRLRTIARDISKVKELEQDLKEQESLYKLVSENSSDLIALHEADGHYKYVSPAVKDLLGYEPDELLGTDPYLLIHEDDIQRLREGPHQTTIQGNSVSQIEFRIKKKDGEFLWVEAYTKPILNAQGEVISFQSSSRDISERKRDRKNLSRLIENTTDSVWAVDKNLKFLFFNSAYKLSHKNRVGFDPEIGKEIRLDLFPKGHAQDKRSMLHKALDGDRVISESKLTIEGDLTVLESTASPIRDDFGKVIGVSVFSRDSTEKYRRVQQVTKYKEGLQLLNELAAKNYNTKQLLEVALKVIGKHLGLATGIVSKIVDDNYEVVHSATGDNVDSLDGQVFDLKDTFCELTFKNDNVLLIDRASDSSYAGHPCHQIMHVESYIGAVIKVGNEKYGTVNFSDQTRRPVSFSSYEGEFMQLFANWIGSAIENGIAYDSLKEAKEKAEAASDAKASFLSMMSHEIRTPLNGIIGVTHLLSNGSPLPEQADHLKILKYSGDNLLAIVNDILDFNKIEEGKITLDEAEFDLLEICEGITANYKIQAAEKGVAVQLSYDSSLGSGFIGDSVRITQVFHNLVNNAVKFTKEGVIDLVVSRTGEHDDYDEILVEVKDTGIGISQEHQEGIFEVFTQADRSTTRKFGGSGLGLSITKKLLELMNSEIQLKSTQDNGSVFYFTLVLKRVENAQPKNDGVSDEYTPLEAKILLVEDNIFNRAIARDFLHSWQCQVDEAENGQEALDKLEQNRYDLILLDLQMPVLDGYQTIKKIRASEDEYLQSIPVVALTASAMSDVRDKVFKLGMSGFVTKPFHPREFYQRLREHLRGSAAAIHSSGADIIIKNIEKLLGQDSTKTEKFIKIFIESLEADINSLGIAVDKLDKHQIRELAHKNKSSLRYVGMDHLADVAVELEQMVLRDIPEHMIIAKSIQFQQGMEKIFEELMETNKQEDEQ